MPKEEGKRVKADSYRALLEHETDETRAGDLRKHIKALGLLAGCDEEEKKKEILFNSGHFDRFAQVYILRAEGETGDSLPHLIGLTLSEYSAGEVEDTKRENPGHDPAKWSRVLEFLEGCDNDTRSYILSLRYLTTN